MDIRNIPIRLRQKSGRILTKNLESHEFYPFGSVVWFKSVESNFGGLSVRVPQAAISIHDKRVMDRNELPGMTGGDRMLHHNYAHLYNRYLQNMISDRLTCYNIAEVGILKGTGLALWSILFPNSNIYGFDIDINHTLNNLENLKNRRAFTKSEPSLIKFDQFVDNRNLIGEVIKNNKFDLIIDDGEHSLESILTTLNSFIPYLAQNFVYIIEDNRHAYKEIKKTYKNLRVENHGLFTVVLPESR